MLSRLHETREIASGVQGKGRDDAGARGRERERRTSFERIARLRLLARIVGAYTKAKGGDLFIGVTHVGDDAANSRTDFARRDPRFRRALFPRGRGTGGHESLAPGICLLVP